MRSMLPVIKAGQSRALLLVTLDGCTGRRLSPPFGRFSVPFMRQISQPAKKALLPPAERPVYFSISF